MLDVIEGNKVPLFEEDFGSDDTTEDEDEHEDAIKIYDKKELFFFELLRYN